jgi:hypothetical protein
MLKIFLSTCVLLFASSPAFVQTCGISQSLSTTQESSLSSILPALDSALKAENLNKIDSLSTELKNVFSTQGGIPESPESYFSLVSATNWLELSEAIQLSRALIENDSMVYVDLWKAAKGMNPPNYQPNSLFLRAAAEIASGLLKIADKETDVERKMAYESWATKALDSLATMQLSNGAFPFPDLRMYGDPVFSPIIQNFINSCGADSVLVLQNGWIIDDKGTGEFKFDAGVIANAYYEAYQYTGNVNYKNIVIALGNYLKPLKFNVNYNYNTFVAAGLTRAFQLTNDSSFLNRAILNLRYAVFPGQLSTGRWVDGHNANSRYHSIIIQNSAETVKHISLNHLHRNQLEVMLTNAVRNMVNYTNTCGSATGFRWLMKALQISSPVITPSLNDSISLLIGRHIRQAYTDGKYLDVPSIGEYLELLGTLHTTETTTEPLAVHVFPNPSNGTLILDKIPLHVEVISSEGKKLSNESSILIGNVLTMQPHLQGMYLLHLYYENHKVVKKIIFQ